MSEDPIFRALREAQEQARLFEEQARLSRDSGLTGALRDAQEQMRLMRDGGFDRFVSEAQERARLLEGSGMKSVLREAQEQALYDNGVARFVREAQEHARLFEGGTLRSILHEAHEQMRMLQDNGIANFMREAQEHARVLQSSGVMQFLRGTWQQQTQALEGVGSTLWAREMLDAAPIYRNVDVMQTNLGVSAATSLASLHEMDFIASELRSIREDLAHEVRNQSEITERFENLIGALSSLEENARNPLEHRAIIKFLAWIIPILFMIWIWQSQHQDAVESQASSDRAAQIAHQDSERIFKAIESLARRQASNEPSNPSRYFDVKRPTPLCSQRKFRGNYAFILLPGAEVQLVERRKKWVKVCALSPEGALFEGWVLKKYLR